MRITTCYVCILLLFSSQLFSKQIPFLSETEHQIQFSTTACTLLVNKQTFGFKLKQNGETVCHAKSLEFKIADEWYALSSHTNQSNHIDKNRVNLDYHLNDDKIASVLVHNVNPHVFCLQIASDEPIVHIRGHILLAEQEEFFGFGEMWNGRVAQRGQKIRIWDQTGTPDECAYMPYYVSTNNYALFLDYGGEVHFDIGSTIPNRLSFDAPTSACNIVVFTGNNIPNVVKHFVEYTGKPHIPPRWAFEPWFWLMGSAWDTNDMKQTGHAHVIAAQKYKELDIPVSVTWFEPKWQTARNSFITPSAFSRDLSAVIDTLHTMGIKVLGWTTPYTTSLSPNWEKAIEKGYLVKKPDGNLVDPHVTPSGEVRAGGYHYIDFLNPNARAWWQNEISRALDAGMDGFKLDAGQDLPADAILYEGRRGKDYHNSYALYYKKTFFDLLSSRLGNDFMMLPRAGWVGSGVFTNFKWPGDLAANFNNNGLPASVFSSLSLAFCGIPFLSTDIGGFESRPPTEHVWIRWAQFGAFLPGMQTLAMPYWFSDRAMQHYRYLSWLHTELVPLWMSLAHEANESGAPVIRPLVWSYQDDRQCWSIKDEFTIGNDLLLAPVITPKHERFVYLPKGRWYDFWDDQQTFQGGRTIKWQGDLWHFPIYIREGAIIPLEIHRHITGFGWPQPPGTITMAVWPHHSLESRFCLHDREDPVCFRMSRQDTVLVIEYSPSKMNYIFRIHDENIHPTRIVVNEKTIPMLDDKQMFIDKGQQSWYHDKNDHKIWLRTNPSTERTCIRVK